MSLRTLRLIMDPKPYLVSPLSAIQAFVKTQSPSTTVISLPTLSTGTRPAPADVALVFVNADSGEEYLTVEGNTYVVPWSLIIPSPRQ